MKSLFWSQSDVLVEDLQSFIIKSGHLVQDQVQVQVQS